MPVTTSRIDLRRSVEGGVRTRLCFCTGPSHLSSWSMRTETETRLTVPCGMRVCFTRRLVWKEIFSVLRLTPFDPEEVVFGGRGRFAAVPGDPALSAEPVFSSVFCDVSITDLLGSTVSSLC